MKICTGLESKCTYILWNIVFHEKFWEFSSQTSPPAVLGHVSFCKGPRGQDGTRNEMKRTETSPSTPKPMDDIGRDPFWLEVENCSLLNAEYRKCNLLELIWWKDNKRDSNQQGEHSGQRVLRVRPWRKTGFRDSPHLSKWVFDCAARILSKYLWSSSYFISCS